MKPFAKIRRFLVYAFATFAFTKLYSKLKFRLDGNCADRKLSTTAVLTFYLLDLVVVYLKVKDSYKLNRIISIIYYYNLNRAIS